MFGADRLTPCSRVDRYVSPKLTGPASVGPSGEEKAMLHAIRSRRRLSTVGHAHCVLHRCFERAAKSEIVVRNVAHVKSRPKVTHVEIKALTADGGSDLPGA